jgi:CBS domain containing-hemolysin-like protein
MGMSAEAIHTTAFIVGFLLFSSLHIVVGEQVPKTFAIRKAEPVSLWVSYPLHYTYLITWPLTWLLNRSTASLLSIFGVEEASHGDILSGDEIKGLVATSREHGEIQGDKADMLRNMFEFDQRLVGRVMIPRTSVDMLDLADTPEHNIAIIRKTEHSRFPVIDNRKQEALHGILLVKDIYHALIDGQSEPWNDLENYCREPLVVPETQPVSRLFDLMRVKRAHMAFVVDEYGVFIGVVSLEDLLEEIVGEIHDETDDVALDTVITETAPNQWEIDGLVSLSDIERLIGLKVPNYLDANTLSGLFFQRLARMPEEGDEVIEGDFVLTILTLEERRVGMVKVCRQSDELSEISTDKGQ